MGGDWVEVGDAPMGRSNADGWRISGGILMFGGSHDNGAPSINVILLDNDYANQGGTLARLKAVWSILMSRTS